MDEKQKKVYLQRLRREKLRSNGLCIQNDGRKISKNSVGMCEECLTRYREYHRRPDIKEWEAHKRKMRRLNKDEA